MHRFGALLIALAALAVAAAPAGAQPIVGVGEQRADVFSNSHFRDLGIRHVRLVVAWDALHSRWQRHEIDAWMAAAEQAGARPLVAFGRSRIARKKKLLPSPARFRKEFRAFRARYPIVRDWVTWNEGNHCSQPTCRRPDVVARYHDIMRRACPNCSIVGADVLDQDNMVPWVQAFRRAARVTPRIWGLHNYLDANRFRTSGTKTLLRAVRGQVWFTETGGLVDRADGKRRHHFEQSTRHAAKATRWVFKLAALSPRVRRVYFYHWQPAREPWATWDSALLDRHGRPRPAYKVLRSYVKKIAAAKRG
jgi:hypothetical protein